MTEHTTDLPRGLVVTDDGSILNWQGVNYVRQDVTAEPATAPSVEQIAEVVHSKTLDWIAGNERVRALAEAIHALYGTPGDAGENRTKALENALNRSAKHAASLRERAEKAEARVEELEDKARFIAAEREQAYAERDGRENAARAEVERCKAALEAAEDLCRAKDRVIEREDEMRTAVRRYNEARERMDAARREHVEAYDAHSAARAAVEAETSEEAGDD